MTFKCWQAHLNDLIYSLCRIREILIGQGDIVMSREENVLNMQITIANNMKQEWNLDFYKVSELLDKYDF